MDGAVKSPTGTIPGKGGKRTQLYYLLLILISVALYANTLMNRYAMDDSMVITENKYVKQGIAGIPTLLTTTHLRGFLHLPNDKYRPLSLVTFATEYGIWGMNPMMSHLVNILLFAGCTVLLMRLLYRLMGDRHLSIAFVAALLFAVHPIHTEVVANIKSRDELLGFLFGISALLLFIAYAHSGRTSRLLQGALLYLLALMSKETSVTFVALAPLLFFGYINENRRRSWHITAMVAGTSVFFIAIAWSVLQLNNTGLPHEASDFTLNALTAAPDTATRYATAIYALGIYLKLLFVPWPLICNYSYAAIPFTGFDNLQVLATIAAYGGLIAFAIYRLKTRQKDVVALGILIYMVVMTMFSNLIGILGSQVAERFLFYPSAGYCLAVAALLYRLAGNQAPESPPALLRIPKVLLILAPLLTVYSVLTVARNAEWKDNETLFSADVAKSPLDSRLNYFKAGVSAPESGTTDIAAYGTQIDYLRRALNIYPDFIQAHTDLARVYEATGAYDSAWVHSIAAIRSKPDNSIATYTAGKVAYARKQYREAVEWLYATVKLEPAYLPARLNLANCYADVQYYDSAINHYRYILAADAKLLPAQRGIAMCYLQTGRYDSAIAHITAAITIAHDPDDMNNLGAVYLTAGRYREALNQFKSLYAQHPGYKPVRANLAITYEQMGLKDSAALYRDTEPDR